MPSRVYPALDPFPKQATRKLDVREPSRPGPRVTIPTPSVTHIWQLADVYLSRFGAEEPSDRGQFVLVRGAHGSGKTHALGYVMEQVDLRCAEPSKTVHDFLQLYVRIESPDFVSTYRKLMLGVAPERLRALAKRFLAVVVAETAGADADDDEVRLEIERWLRNDPDRVSELFDRYFVDPGTALERQADEVAGVTDETEDFRRAFSYLHEPERGPSAATWLRGDDPGAAALRRLGVSGPIDTPEMARRGLQLLATLCGRAGTALFIYLDQYEKLVVGEPELVAGNAGLLSGLAEAIPPADAMIVLCGNLAAWRKAPEDLPQRFAYNLVECRGFDFDAAASLLYVWLHSGADEAISARDDDAVWPLTIDAIRVMHLETGGNPRRLLQLASRAFRAAQPEEKLIDGEVVRGVLREAGQVPIDPDFVLAVVRLLAESEGFSVQHGAHGHPNLRLAFGGADRLLLMLGQATYYYDEVLDAVGQLDAIEALRRQAPGARAVLVVLGYDSPGVRETLARAGIESIAYRQETFARDLRPILTQAREVAASAGDTTRISQELTELRATLEDLRSQREVEARGVAAGAEQVATHAAQRDLLARWEDGLRSWATERRRITDRIADVRKVRRDEDLADLERLRARAESQRRVRILTVAGVLIAIILLLLFVREPQSSLAFDLRPYVWALGILAGLAIVVFAYGAVILRGPWMLRDVVWRGRALSELAAPVASLGDLQRLARGFADREPRPAFVVRHANPQVRYAASMLTTERVLGPLVKTLPAERSAVVRHAFALRLAGHPEAGAAAVERASQPWTPEALYIYERLLRTPPPLDLHVPAADLLRRLLKESKPLSPAVRALAPVIATSSLDSAFLSGLPFESRGALHELPLGTVRRTIRALSPFDEGGLGTYDALDALDLVDQAYLELSQVVFLSELGLLVDTSR